MEKFDPQLYGENEIERTTLRIDHKTKERLAIIAQNAGISLNTLMIRCIHFALDNMV